MSNRNLRRIHTIHTTVSAQTLYHLENMRKFSGYKDIGQVIDKLVREKRISQSMYIQEGNHDNSNKHR